MYVCVPRKGFGLSLSLSLSRLVGWSLVLQVKRIQAQCKCTVAILEMCYATDENVIIITESQRDALSLFLQQMGKREREREIVFWQIIALANKQKCLGNSNNNNRHHTSLVLYSPPLTVPSAACRYEHTHTQCDRLLLSITGGGLKQGKTELQVLLNIGSCFTANGHTTISENGVQILWELN